MKEVFPLVKDDMNFSLKNRDSSKKCIKINQITKKAISRGAASKSAFAKKAKSAKKSA
ncbi:hypothetical protein FBY54_1065 [Zymomonas mobilis]|uniref:hypothetical protein n=1 Tax=Zymomonas mobilis TaxID=542 RepID=UPI0011672C8D|nr:hypothetical protein [Zymomonas mobilis]TQL30213.1 hypothetical protein FBY54_1065 [Zymomonas mobilis]